MDKDLLRIVILVTGGLVILGMVLWSVFKNRNARRSIDFYDKGNPLDKIDPSLVLKTENDDFDIVPLGSALDDGYEDDPISVAVKQSELDPEEKSYEQSYQEELSPEPVKKELPKLIQFSLVAVAEKGFNGADLVAAFERVGLEYGSVKVFERLDELRRVDFTVASMVGNGTFPETGMESFYTPGIVFFIQPAELDNPVQIYDELIQTINLLADQLDGIQWDHNQHPLTEATIQKFRMHML